MCPTDFLDEGGIICRQGRMVQWGSEPFLSLLTLQVQSIERMLGWRYPTLAFSISLEWVDLEARYETPRTPSEEGGLG